MFRDKNDLSDVLISFKPPQVPVPVSGGQTSPMPYSNQCQQPPQVKTMQCSECYSKFGQQPTRLLDCNFQNQIELKCLAGCSRLSKYLHRKFA